MESFLSVYLEPIAAYLAQPDVTDIYINRPGEIWVETLGGATRRAAVSGLSEELLWRLARQVASLNHQAINRAEPLLSAKLPDGSRIQIVAPPATRGPMALAIRKHVAMDIRLEDYASAGAFGQTTKGQALDPAEAELRRHYEAEDWMQFLRLAVHARKTIMISGGTSTGKTTFLNALIREIPERERLILIEDTPELNCRHENAVGLVAVRGAMGEANVGSEDLLTASLRLRPDRIVLGELRGGEAMTFLRAINTGHPGSMTTVHANSIDHAVEQLALLAGQAANMPRGEIVEYVRATVDVQVQLARLDGARKVSAIRWTGHSS